MLILLQVRRRVTAQELAREFEVSVRTIYRDMDSLSAAGVPVYGDSGPGGGFRLIDGYRTRLTGLDVDEAEALSVSALPEQAAALGLGVPARRAQSKLIAALPESSAQAAERLSGRFHVDPTDWYRAADRAPHLPMLARAVLDQCCLAMRYESWTTEADWRVEPLGLVLKGGAWYLVAASGGTIRRFRVSAIRTMETLPDRFERPASFDLADDWARSLERFERDLRPDRAVLTASQEGLRRLSALGAFAERAVAEAVSMAPGRWRVTLPMEVGEHGLRQLLAIGPEIELVEPAAMRRRLHALADAIASRHSD